MKYFIEQIEEDIRICKEVYCASYDNEGEYGYYNNEVVTTCREMIGYYGDDIEFPSFVYNKLDEEVEEVAGAILMNDKENLTEELLDVIQCCYGIAFTKGINLEEHIKEHNEKLLNRNHKFID